MNTNAARSRRYHNRQRPRVRERHGRIPLCRCRSGMAKKGSLEVFEADVMAANGIIKQRASVGHSRLHSLALSGCDRRRFLKATVQQFFGRGDLGIPAAKIVDRRAVDYPLNGIPRVVQASAKLSIFAHVFVAVGCCALCAHRLGLVTLIDDFFFGIDNHRHRSFSIMVLGVLTISTSSNYHTNYI